MPTAAGLFFTVHEGGQVDLPPVLLIHGAGGTSLTWPSDIRRMPGQRIFAVDLPGHGRSGGFAQQSIPAYADQISALLEDLGLSEVVLVGHSMGGAIALTLALKYPRLVSGLGLIASGAFLSVDPLLIEELGNPVTVLSALQRLERLSFSPATSPNLVKACMQPIQAARYSLLLADWLACAAFDLREMIDQINAPAWVACGVDDRITPMGHARFLVDRLCAQLQIIPNAGHMVLQEQPAEVTQGLRNFLTVQLPEIQTYRWQLLQTFAPADKKNEN